MCSIIHQRIFQYHILLLIRIGIPAFHSHIDLMHPYVAKPGFMKGKVYVPFIPLHALQHVRLLRQVFRSFLPATFVIFSSNNSQQRNYLDKIYIKIVSTYDDYFTVLVSFSFMKHTPQTWNTHLLYLLGTSHLIKIIKKLNLHCTKGFNHIKMI